MDKKDRKRKVWKEDGPVAIGPEFVLTNQTPLRQSPSRHARKVEIVPKGAQVRLIPQDWWLVEWVPPGSGEPLKGWVRVSDLLRLPAAEKEPVKLPPSAPSPDGADYAKHRLMIAAQILEFEARRDARRRLQIYDLPSMDGGGSYEVAGINQRYHPKEAAALRELVEHGQHAAAEKRATEYIASYTDVVGGWTQVLPIESYLRDCTFHRGPAGAAKILQLALGTKVDGRIGPVTVKKLRRAEERPAELLSALREARETYELQVAGMRSKFWKGLVRRWNGALDFSRKLA